jgi:hypothetical protein
MTPFQTQTRVQRQLTVGLSRLSTAKLSVQILRDMMGPSKFQYPGGPHETSQVSFRETVCGARQIELGSSRSLENLSRTCTNGGFVVRGRFGDALEQPASTNAIRNSR